MEEVKSLAKRWNNEVVVPSLSTSLCMVSGPGTLGECHFLLGGGLLKIGGSGTFS